MAISSLLVPVIQPRMPVEEWVSMTDGSDLPQQYGQRVRLDLLVLGRVELGILDAQELIERFRIVGLGTARPGRRSGAPRPAARDRVATR